MEAGLLNNFYSPHCGGWDNPDSKEIQLDKERLALIEAGHDSLTKDEHLAPGHMESTIHYGPDHIPNANPIRYEYIEEPGRPDIDELFRMSHLLKLLRLSRNDISLRQYCCVIECAEVLPLLH